MGQVRLGFYCFDSLQRWYYRRWGTIKSDSNKKNKEREERGWRAEGSKKKEGKKEQKEQKEQKDRRKERSKRAKKKVQGGVGGEGRGRWKKREGTAFFFGFFQLGSFSLG